MAEINASKMTAVSSLLWRDYLFIRRDEDIYPLSHRCLFRKTVIAAIVQRVITLPFLKRIIIALNPYGQGINAYAAPVSAIKRKKSVASANVIAA
ncbi:hypothetical protein QL200_07280 [Cronobacter dublinensis]|uniref:hypothetical protein n=1 Tax=Cronobacter dublinensis TaxID=413497 RepID=UPI00138B1071|nr:hypothetical protein [Cronobacter dublinensis]MDI6425742.1 hypothetical protein [Cronobacter dublinensis]